MQPSRAAASSTALDHTARGELFVAADRVAVAAARRWQRPVSTARCSVEQYAQASVLSSRPDSGSSVGWRSLSELTGVPLGVALLHASRGRWRFHPDDPPWLKTCHYLEKTG